MAVANSRWLLKMGEGVGGAFSTSSRSVIINDNRSVAVIVGSAHGVGKKINSIRDAYCLCFTDETFKISIMFHRWSDVKTTGSMITP